MVQQDNCSEQKKGVNFSIRRVINSEVKFFKRRELPFLSISFQ